MRILIVEDEALFAQAVGKRLGRGGHDCRIAGSIGEAGALLDAAGAPFDLLLLDERLPDGSGVDLMLSRRGEAGRALPPVIMMTAFADIDHAVSAMKLGALDYIRKPVDLERVLAAVTAAGAGAPLRRAATDASAPARAEDAPGLVGDSAAMVALRRRIKELARLDLGEAGTAPPTVLITGETGSGKEVAARLLHAAGPRRDKPFLQVDCTALPRELFESELFGHEKGAFTGAATRKAGLVESAGEGSLFLDEIGELPLEAQAKLLALLDRRRYRRVGGTVELRTGARFLAATNRDLEAMVAEGRFRGDLLYRLRVLSIPMPALRDRSEDIAPLTAHFARQTARQYGRPLPDFEATALERLGRHAWPGNVRELKHVIERAVLLDQDGRISAGDIELVSSGSGAAPPDVGNPGVAPTPAVAPNAVAPPAASLGETEKRLIEDALARSGGNVSKAARLLGVTRMTLRYRVDKHGIAIPGKEDLRRDG